MIPKKFMDCDNLSLLTEYDADNIDVSLISNHLKRTITKSGVKVYRANKANGKVFVDRYIFVSRYGNSKFFIKWKNDSGGKVEMTLINDPDKYGISVKALNLEVLKDKFKLEEEQSEVFFDNKKFNIDKSIFNIIHNEYSSFKMKDALLLLFKHKDEIINPGIKESFKKMTNFLGDEVNDFIELCDKDVSVFCKFYLFVKMGYSEHFKDNEYKKYKQFIKLFFKCIKNEDIQKGPINNIEDMLKKMYIPIDFKEYAEMPTFSISRYYPTINHDKITQKEWDEFDNNTKETIVELVKHDIFSIGRLYLFYISYRAIPENFRKYIPKFCMKYGMWFGDNTFKCMARIIKYINENNLSSDLVLNVKAIAYHKTAKSLEKYEKMNHERVEIFTNLVDIDPETALTILCRNGRITKKEIKMLDNKIS